MHRVSREIGGRTYWIESGKLAKQANGSVLVGCGDTRILATVCSSKEPKVGIDFFPLTVEFAEKFYAAGKIPGSFHKREGRPTQEATLSARMIDRPIRPLFPEGYYYDTQLVITVLSADPEADLDVAAALGASAALHLSDIPFRGPTAACRMGRVQGKWVINPTWKQIHKKESDLEILVAGTADAIMMVEGGAQEASESDVLQAILQGHKVIQQMIPMIEELRQLAGKPKKVFTADTIDTRLTQMVRAEASAGLAEALRTKDKPIRAEKISHTKKALQEAFLRSALFSTAAAELVAAGATSESAKGKLVTAIKSAFENLQYQLMREMILSEGIRIDGRDTQTIRPIAVEVGLLPRAHGSACFTRGETQVLAAVTLGTSDDEQIIDSLFENSMRQFMLHYNFPPFSVGETGRMGGQSRREIGHGALAERSILARMPGQDRFPYTVRIVCETLESNGSSSMGSVCSASMALMDAGVAFVKPVAGIAMGLIKEDQRMAVLSDILGDEDHLGDMDFKVAGTADGITGIQMDIKIEGVDQQILEKALAQAKLGRLHILKEMSHAIEAPRGQMSLYAPRITTIMVPVDKIREVIGSGGKVIKDIIAQTGCKIDINDDGKINIASNDGEAAQKAIDLIRGITAQVEVGTVYKGTVKKIVEFGAFVSILPNQEGLLHISEIAHERVQNVQDYLKEGDVIDISVLEVDKSGKIRLSRKVLLPVPAGQENRGNSGGSGAKRPPLPRPNR